MPQFNEQTIQDAVNAYKNGKFPSIRQTADAFCLAYPTLRRRLQTTQGSRHEASTKRQKLSPIQEQYLAQWITDEDRCARAPSHAMVRQMAECLARENGDNEPCGKNWIDGFLRRNPTISTMVGHSIEATRVTCASKDILLSWFSLLRSLLDGYSIKTANIWNFDEHGIALGCGTNGRVLAPIQANNRKKTYVKTPEDREWVSIIECISAVGSAISPLVIFKGQNLQSTWFPPNIQSLENWHWTATKKAWTSNEIGVKWLETKFLLETTPATGTTEYRLLICDGHGSHATVDFMKLCKDNRVILLYLPAHTSHLLQPLDISCFSPLKSRYHKELGQLSSLDDSAPIKKHNFISLYSQSRMEALNNHNIRAGFRGAGIWPLNPDKVLNSTQLNVNHTIVPRQITPELISYAFQTPKGPKDIYSQEYDGISAREFRAFQGKIAKSISTKNAEIATLKAQVARLEKTVEDISGIVRKRKRVVPDPNERFARIDQIVAAQEAAKKAEQREAEKQVLYDAEETSREIEKTTFESLCLKFQL
jgi:DDE superfamily endonuclease/Tc5 transposase DNA-binding domain